jgi:hypothetical protein
MKNFGSSQSVRMSLWKNRPKCSPTHFCVRINTSTFPWEKVPSQLGYFWNYKKFQSYRSPNGLEFAWSGHPVSSLCTYIKVGPLLFVFQSKYEPTEPRKLFQKKVSFSNSMPLDTRVARFYWPKPTKSGKIIPNDQKLFQMAINDTKLV